MNALGDRLWPFWNRLVGVHVALYRATGGRIGHRMIGAPPMLLLDHTGARSGVRRTTALAYMEDGDALVVVASKGGHPQHPAWYHNLRSNPDTTAQIGSERRPVRARVATPEERGRLWPRIVDAYGGFASYQQRTEREIPLVILDRR
jgi:deazaflavin-dependent oxidoreductase (nitroreductase family)